MKVDTYCSVEVFLLEFSHIRGSEVIAKGLVVRFSGNFNESHSEGSEEDEPKEVGVKISLGFDVRRLLNTLTFAE